MLLFRFRDGFLVLGFGRGLPVGVQNGEVFSSLVQIGTKGDGGSPVISGDDTVRRSAVDLVFCAIVVGENSATFF